MEKEKNEVMAEESEDKKEKFTHGEYYLGKFGGAIPLISMFIMLAALSISGLTNGRNFWAAGMAAMLLGFILIKNKAKYQDILLDGLSDRMLAMILLTFFVSGILSVLLTTGGLCDGLVYLAVKLNVPAGVLPAVIFLVCVIISTSTGTTSGTVIAATPVLLPLAYKLGCSPAVVMGAIVGGGFFGDNLAPVSDTTIASAGTQDAEIVDVVRSRLKYSLVAGIIAFVLYIVVGFSTTKGALPDVGQDSSALWSLFLLACPVLLVIMMVKGKNFIYSLIMCSFLALIIDILLGTISLNVMFAKDGVLVSAIDNSLTAAVLCMLVFIIMQVFKSSGAFDALSESIVKVVKNHKQAEGIVGLLGMLGSLLMGGATYSIILSGKLSRNLLKSYNVERTRGANLLDGLACGTVGLLPWAGAVLVGVAQAISTGAVSEDFTALEFIPYNFHCMLLIVVYWVAILSGWGCKFEYVDSDGVTKYVKKYSELPESVKQ